MFANLIEQGWQVSMPNPYQVRQWAKAQSRRTKTDRLDAKVLAEYGVSRTLPTWKPLPAHLTQLDELLKRQQDLKETLRQEKNHLSSLAAQGIDTGPAMDSIQRAIAWLEAELERLQKELDQFLKIIPTFLS